VDEWLSITQLASASEMTLNFVLRWLIEKIVRLSMSVDAFFWRGRREGLLTSHCWLRWLMIKIESPKPEKEELGRWIWI